MSKEDEREADRWHLDKRVPIALILTIIFQTATGVWWASQISGRVDVAERDLRRVEVQADRDRDEWRRGLSDLRSWMEGRFDRLEQKIEGKADRQK